VHKLIAVSPFPLASLGLLLSCTGPVQGQERQALGIVFVCDGSGDFRTVSTSLSQAIRETGLSLAVETVVWSHGYGRYIKDHVDHQNHLVMGRSLAERVLCYRRYYPHLRIYLIGHSAGCAVVLAAAEVLPPDTVDRIVLLAPSVSPQYDLRPALASAREGIDAFVSERDRFILGLCMRIVGTADGKRGAAAGRVGFRPAICTPTDAALYGRLRQHPWQAGVLWTGHLGGHYGTNRICFTQAYVLPLFLTR